MTSGVPCGVNNAGTVCGTAETSNPLLQAVVWAGGTKLALKGAKFYITRSAGDINDQGVIVGYSEYTRSLAATEPSCGPVQPSLWSC